MSQLWIIDSGRKLELFTAAVKSQFDRFTDGEVKDPPALKFVEPGRSQQQNDMIYALYAQIGRQKPDESMNDIKRECKLVYGCPILLPDPKFAKAYWAMKENLSYEEMLDAMDILPVTRLFNKKQATEYIDVIIREYSNQGYSLIHPSEDR